MENWDKRLKRFSNLSDPAIPAVDKLLGAHTAITRHVEDHEEVTDLLAVHLVGLALLIPKECGADGSELVDVDGFVTEILTISYHSIFDQNFYTWQKFLKENWQR